MPTIADLAPEIYDHIVSIFEHSEEFQIDSPEAHSFSGYHVLEYDRLFSKGEPDVATLGKLRLTSKSFHRAVSRVWLPYVCLHWGPGSFYDSPGDQASSRAARHDFASTIRHVKLDFRNEYSNTPLLHSTYRLSSLTDPAPDGDDANQFSFTGRSIPYLLQRTPHLESLELMMEPWESEYRGSGDGFAEKLNMPFLATVTDSLGASLATFAFEGLSELRLWLTCTHDFIRLSQQLPDSLLGRLKRLFLGVTDATGPGGSKNYLHWADENGDWDEGFPLSNVQELYPNAQYASGVFEIIFRCPNLKSLGLHGTHILDGDILDWEPTSGGLEDLYLRRVKFSPDKLIQLLSPNSGLPLSSSSLSRVWLEDVDLMLAEWSEVFAHLRRCPLLSYFNPRNLGYSRGSELYHLRPWNFSIREDFMNLLATHPPDEEGLESLVQMLIQREGEQNRNGSVSRMSSVIL